MMTLLVYLHAKTQLNSKPKETSIVVSGAFPAKPHKIGNIIASRHNPFTCKQDNIQVNIRENLRYRTKRHSKYNVNP